MMEEIRDDLIHVVLRGRVYPVPMNDLDRMKDRLALGPTERMSPVPRYEFESLLNRVGRLERLLTESSSELEGNW